MDFICFMATTAGRVLRVVLGLSMIAVGLTRRRIWGYPLAVLGLLPLAAGIFDFCLLAPTVRLPFKGKETRGVCTGAYPTV